MYSCFVSTSTSFGSAAASRSRTVPGSAPGSARTSPSEMDPGVRYGKRRRKFRSLVTIVASIPKDTPSGKSPSTVTRRWLTSVTTSSPARRVAATGPNSGRESSS